METPDKIIVSFLSDHTIASVALLTEDRKPYCVTCFYVYDESTNCLLFKSSFGTFHDQLMKESAPVSGTVLPESIDLVQIKGIQFTGKLLSLQDAASLKNTSLYTQKYMMSLALPGYMWGIKLDYVKLTDNSLGFGHKITWGTLT